MQAHWRKSPTPYAYQAAPPNRSRTPEPADASTTQCSTGLAPAAALSWGSESIVRAVDRIVHYMRDRRLLYPNAVEGEPCLSAVLRESAPSSDRRTKFFDEVRATFARHPSADKMYAAVKRFTADWAEAERADSLAVTRCFSAQLAKIVQAAANQSSLYACRRPTRRPDLTYLAAPHFDDCLFDLSAPLAEGGNGTMHVGITGRGVGLAVKVRKNSRDAERGRIAFDREAKLITKGADYGVLYILHTREQSFLVMPLFAGTLSTYAATFLSPQDNGVRYDLGGNSFLPAARFVFRELLNGLTDLRERAGVVHQDLKPSNIFVDAQRRRLLIGDFGEADEMGEDGICELHGRTYRFAAPEQCEEIPWVNHKSDLYSLGVMMYHMLISACEPIVMHRREYYPNQTHGHLFWRDSQRTARRVAQPLYSNAALNAATSQQLSGMPEVNSRPQRQLHFRFLESRCPANIAEGHIYDRQAMTNPKTTDWADRHFYSIHQSVAAKDASLEGLLRSLVAYDDSKRPSHFDALARLNRIDYGDGSRSDENIDASWRQIPINHHEHQQEIFKLNAALDELFPPSRQAAP